MTSRVEKRDLVLWHECAGELSARGDVALTFLVPGKVEAVRVVPGERVKKGDPIAVLDTSDMRIELRRAEAALEAAAANLARLEKGLPEGEMAQIRSAVEQAQLGYDNAKLNLERMERLFREGAVSLQQKEGAQLQADMAWSRLQAALKQLEAAEKGPDEESLRAARAQVEQARAARDAARRQIELATLTAPFDGVVSAISVEPGEMVSSGVPVARVVDDSAFYAELWVSADIAGKLKPGGSALIRLGFAGSVGQGSNGRSGSPGEDLQGTVSDLGLSPDPRAKQYRVRVAIEAHDHPGELVPGAVVSVALELAKRKGVLAVPRKALVEVDGSYIVYVVEDGKARERKVSLGLQAGDYGEVLDGLSAGDEVIVEGHHFVKDGTPVRLAGGGPGR